MTNQVAALGYGFHLPESLLMLDLAAVNRHQAEVRDRCIEQWPQPSETNKIKMWNHLSRRYLRVDGTRIIETPFLTLYTHLSHTTEKLELVFFQLCQSTPLILEVLRSLAKDTLMETGTATFTKFHLDQILEAQFGHVAKSTSERLRQILRHAGRLRLEGKNYIAASVCPCEAVLGLGLYTDAEKYGWRSPSTSTVLSQSDVMATFLCNRSQLIGGLKRLASRGLLEFVTHGSSNQIQLAHRSAQEFADAWPK